MTDVPEPVPAEFISREIARALFPLRQAGKLVLNGPSLDEGDLRGIAIFDGAGIEDVHGSILEDPLVKAGFLVAEILEPRPAAGRVMFVGERRA